MASFVIVLFGCLLLLFTASSTSVVEMYILEELPPASYVGNVAIDADVYRDPSPEVAATMRFRILFQSPPSVESAVRSDGLVASQPALFSIDQLTGDVRTLLRIDREEYCRQAGRCAARVDVVVHSSAVFDIVRVRIHVLDINDHEPVFPVPVFSYSLPESQNADTLTAPSSGFLVPEADDPDGPAFGVQRYAIVPTTEHVENNATKTRTADATDLPFDVIHAHGQLRIVPTQLLDRETVARSVFFDVQDGCNFN